MGGNKVPRPGPDEAETKSDQDTWILDFGERIFPRKKCRCVGRGVLWLC